jgi:predicted ATP-grasp superfamily ATP-dependent carboligase
VSASALKGKGPPARVLVLDGHSSAALAFVRSLGKLGTWVAVGYAAGATASATLSRYCRMRWAYPNPTQSTSGFAAALEEFVKDHAINQVIPMTDATLFPLASIQAENRHSVRLAVPPTGVVDAVSDKYQTIVLAHEMGIRVSETHLIRSLAELPHFDRRHFPRVVKDRYSVRWTKDQGIPGSVSYAYSPEELREQVATRLNRAGDVLVQEFTHGTGIGFSCFIHEGEAYLPFQWVRLREKDPRGSGSSARRSIALDPELARSCRRLLAQTGLGGLAMVEFKQRQGKGEYVLMEINGRPWGSLQLPIHCGIDYPRHLFSWYLEGKLPPRQLDYRVGITCRWLAADLVHLENLWQGKPPGWPGAYPGFWSSLVRVAVPWYPGLRYDDLAWNDPKPGLFQLGKWLRRHLGG